MVTILLRTCNISSINYASGDIKVIKKTKTEINERPAILLTIKNVGEIPATNIELTAKAKLNQRDKDFAVIKLTRLEPSESIEKAVVFKRLQSHQDYELLTIAVSHE